MGTIVTILPVITWHRDAAERDQAESGRMGTPRSFVTYTMSYRYGLAVMVITG